MNNEPIKLCVNCKHYIEHIAAYSGSHFCVRRPEIVSMVTGKSRFNPRCCDEQRKAPFPDRDKDSCSADAFYYVERDVTTATAPLLSMNTIEANTPQSHSVPSGALFGVWVATADNPYPEKPGKYRYEIVPCLVVHEGEIEICAWNCEHGVWDDADGDDFRYVSAQVSHWMPLPSLPSPNKH